MASSSGEANAPVPGMLRQFCVAWKSGNVPCSCEMVRSE